MRHTSPTPARHTLRTRLLSLLLAAALSLGLAPGLATTAQASDHWATPYLDQMVANGYMRTGLAETPDKDLTRAEFMAIVNRAYGYDRVGPTPFEDVAEDAWYYDDVSIAYTANYIKGTSETTASPNLYLTRETATTILGRNMLLEEAPGESIDFVDSREISNWARGMVKSCVDNYIISGYDDGSFQPQEPVSVAEMAVLICRCVGTPLQEPGDYSLGGVFGNVTVSSPGVTLRDTVISGDLYITGGVGLGDIKLENVTVLGRIIASGTGEGEMGDASIVMRNVTADQMLVDNLQNQYVSVRAEGVTEIGAVTVRTPAYLEDNTPEGLGLKQITLEPTGDEEVPSRLDLAGRVKEVAVKAPEAAVKAARGTVAKLTMDEEAVDATLTIDRGAEVKELNLDAGVTVSGQGDIEHLTVAAPGAVVTMLPDKITIRPGIIANIAGQDMDATAAEEASRDPKILSGYPLVNDLAPTTFSAVFSTNKKGTVYWAVSPLTDGSVDADELVNPPTYGSIAVAHGSVLSPQADTLVQAPVTGLIPGGSYYLAAVMEDDRGERSPLKVIALTTPDNTVPAFLDPTPYMSMLKREQSQVTVMPSKTCKLYYVLLPEGAAAPTVQELKSNAVEGNLGYGVRDVVKNTEDSFFVNDLTLEEEVTYDLYLWLTDADGANSSAIEKLTFTTVDETPPEFLVDPTANKVQAQSVSMMFRLNEDGVVYWAVVKAGEKYPKPQPGESTVLLTDPYAILQVTSGLNALQSGKVTAKEAADGTITVSGLEPETAYDLYYVAQDDAGNYSLTVKKVTINTLDAAGPIVTQYFSDYAGLDNTKDPMPDTAITLEFSENVRFDGEDGGLGILELYEAIDKATGDEKDEAKQDFVDSLKGSITLYQVTRGSGQGSEAVNSDTSADDWVIDYSKARVESEDGKVRLIFPTEALQLGSGSTYYFELKNLTDTSTAQNPTVPATVNYNQASVTAGHKVPQFTTVFAQLYMVPVGLGTDQLPVDPTPSAGEDPIIPVDFSFRVVPQSTSKVGNNISYDLLLFTDSTIEYDLYYRAVDASGEDITTDHKMPNWETGAKKFGEAGWYYLGNSGQMMASRDGASLHRDFNGCDNSNFPALNGLKDDGTVYYEFAISLTTMGTSDTRETWSGAVTFDIYAVAGTSYALDSLAKNPVGEWDRFIENGLASNSGGVSIGSTDENLDYLSMRQPFTDTQPPNFADGYPQFEVGDTFVNMKLNLDRDGTIYYIVAPREGGIAAKVQDQTDNKIIYEDSTTDADRVLWDQTPKSGNEKQPGVAQLESPQKAATILQPSNLNIAEPKYTNPEYIIGTPIKYEGGQETHLEELKNCLMEETDYYVYFVLKGAATDLSPIYMYKFTTTDIAKPKITLERVVSGTVNVTTHVDANVDYAMFTAEDFDRISLFKGTLNTTANSKYYNRIPITSKTAVGDVDHVTSYDDMTIIEALMTTYDASLAATDNTTTDVYAPDSSYNGYSVFDVYASDAVKAEVARAIRTGVSTATGTAGGEFISEAQKAHNVDEREVMTPLTNHYFLTVAYHTSSAEGVGDAFKATNNVTIPDTIPPVPTKVSTVVKNPEKGAPYSGTVTIEFSKELYWSSGSGGTTTLAKPVHATYTYASADAKWVSIIQYMGGSLGSPLKKLQPVGTVTSPSISFTLSFSDVYIGDTVTFFSSGDITNVSGYRAQGKKLSLTFVAQETTTTGKDSPLTYTSYKAGFEATWDGEKIESVMPETPPILNPTPTPTPTP